MTTETNVVTVQTKDYLYTGPDDSVSIKLLKESARLREALEFYADFYKYNYGGSIILKDAGEIARKAMKGEST